MIYLIYSIIFVFGGCCIYISVFVIVFKYFLKYCLLVIGMIVVGFGVGIFVMSFILVCFIEEFGWCGVFFVMVGIIVFVCFFGCVFDFNVLMNFVE